MFIVATHLRFFEHARAAKNDFKDRGERAAWTKEQSN